MKTSETIEFNVTVTGVQKYWMVHGIGQGTRAPNMRHESIDAAQREAKRLALANEGVPFTVLEVVDAFYMPPKGPQRLPISDAELPF